MLDFVEDKSVLHLFPIEEMDKEEGGGGNLEVYNFNNDDTAVGVEAHLWDAQEYFAVIKGYYNLRDQFPKFVFHYFSCYYTRRGYLKSLKIAFASLYFCEL